MDLYRVFMLGSSYTEGRDVDALFKVQVWNSQMLVCCWCWWFPIVLVMHTWL